MGGDATIDYEGIGAAIEGAGYAIKL